MKSENINPRGIGGQREKINLDQLIHGLENKDRSSLSKAITFLESTSAKHGDIKSSLLEWAYSKNKRAKRIGITGAPGVGKSTFIEKFGKLLVNKGNTVAVLSIDPSSSISGGSILGDKTRMEELSALDQAYIRPSPSSNMLGGVAGATRESIAICEAMGFDWIIVETVGVGQSEYAVHKMTDLFLLLLLPGAGDSLQGIKRGIVEMADMAIVNKSDGSGVEMASKTKLAYQNAMRLFGEKDSQWSTKVYTVSSLEEIGIEEAFVGMEQYFRWIEESGYWSENRKKQALIWFREALKSLVIQSLYQRREINSKIEEVEKMILEEKIAPGLAADLIVEDWVKTKE